MSTNRVRPTRDETRSRLFQAAAEVFAKVGVGAALFEEFVFRLVLISVTLLLMQKLFHVPSSAAQIVAVCASAALFATAHPPSSGNDAEAQLEFLYRVSAGIYLGAIYLKRGFATVTIVHAAFNIIAVLLIS